MRSASRLRFAGAAVLLTFAGVWLSHTLEMVRVLGAAGLVPALGRPVHAYMIPVGLALAAFAVATAVRAVRVWRHLGARLDAAAVAVRSLLRTGRAPERPPVPGAAPTITSRLLVLWLPLAGMQMSVYAVQENLEYRAVGLSAPGLGVLTGAHWGAPLIHLYVAFVLAAIALLMQRARVARSAAVVVVTRLLRRLEELRSRAGRGPHRRPTSRPAVPTAVGSALWGRPPPSQGFATSA